MNEGYIKSLDGLRAIAILLVMAFHAELIGFGWMGVQLFFVLSGFLITGILWREKDKNTTTGFKLKKFWVRRSLRIFPLYFGYLAFLGITYLVAGFPAYYEKYIPYLATYTFNYTRLLDGWEGNPLFTHLWSLSIEEQFYLFFPLLVLLAPRRIIPVLMISVVVLVPLVRFFLFDYFLSKADSDAAADAVYWHTAAHLDAFFMGGLIPVMGWQRKKGFSRKWVVLAGVLVVLAGMMSYVFIDDSASFFYHWGYPHAATHSWSPVWSYTLLNLFFASVVLFLVSRPGSGSRLQRLLEHSWLVRIGRVSYGMYLFHWAILVYLFARLYPSGAAYWKWVFFPFYAAAVFGFAALSYRFYEARFLMLKDKWFGSGRQPAEEAPRVIDLKVSGKRD